MVTYFSWWYGEGLIGFWTAIQIMTEKVFAFFSIKILSGTLFAPWKRDAYTVENASLEIRVRIWFNNLISRVIGFIIRLFTIFLGLLTTLIFFSFFIILLLAWIFLPILILFLIITGIQGAINA